MSMETNLLAILSTICPRVFPDIAPADTAMPYITWQGIGGASYRHLDNTAADKRNTLMQVNVWSPSRLQALLTIRLIESACCSSDKFICSPTDEPLSTYDDESHSYGCIQRFSIISAR